MSNDHTVSARALASRRNGARSRGPGTAAGKARTARNALKHGLRARRLARRSGATSGGRPWEPAALDDENASEFRAFRPRHGRNSRHRALCRANWSRAS